jgi:2-polyprenyl-6-methoxyphenol hydroxylase-like FAD-dependent oxidoreductase
VGADAVVVGGGIGGAVLAELLARRGKRVIVLERHTSPPSFLRPEVLWPASIELLCSLHSREVLEREVALPVRGIRAMQGREKIVSLTPEMLREIDVQPWFVNPNDARELLLRRASFELRRGVEVVEVLREGERVVGVRARELATGAVTDVLAQHTIGDDGTHSLVRQACGIAIELKRFPVDFLCFALSWPASFEPAVARIWVHPDSGDSGVLAFGAMPFVHGRGAGLVLVRSTQFDASKHVAQAWNALLDSDPLAREVAGKLAFPSGATRVVREFGHAASYGAPGAFLVGDAAHPVSPAGGQGANMAIADARVLAELLATGRGDVLREYEHIRRAANARSVRISSAAARVLELARGPIATITFEVARRMLRRELVVERAVLGASRSFVERP